MQQHGLLLVPMLMLAHCTSVGPLTYRLSHNPPPKLVAVEHVHGMRIETWHISGKPYSRAYFKEGKKVKEKIFTENGRLYVERSNLTDGREINKMYDEQGRLTSLSENVPGNPVWRRIENYNSDGSVRIRGKWRPVLSPEQAKASGIFEQIARGFDRIPAGGVLPKSSQHPH